MNSAPKKKRKAAPVRIWLCGPVSREILPRNGKYFAIILSASKPRVDGHWWTGHYAGTYRTKFGQELPGHGECWELRRIKGTFLQRRSERRGVKGKWK